MAMASPSGRTRAFISYSHKDKRYLERLQTHMALYERTGLVDLWDDTKIQPGSNWREEIRRAINSAKVAILLVSADFLASEFIAKDELPSLLAAAKQGGAIILPVILSPCSFNYTELAQFQSVNDPGKPLSKITTSNRDEIWVRVAELVRDALHTQKPNDGRSATISLDKPPTSTNPGKDENTSNSRSKGATISSAEASFNPKPLVTQPSPLPPSPPQKTKEEWLAEGYTLAGRGQLEEALSAFEQAIKLDHTFAPAHFGKGDTLMKLKSFTEALPALEQTIKLDPNVAAAHRRKGFVLNQLRKHTGALETLKKAIELDPDHPLAYVGKGDALKEEEQYADALRAYQQAAKLDPKLADAYVGKGDVLVKLREYGAALEAYEQALQLEAKNERASSGKSLVLQLMSQPRPIADYRSSSYQGSQPVSYGSAPPYSTPSYGVPTSYGAPATPHPSYPYAQPNYSSPPTPPSYPGSYPASFDAPAPGAPPIVGFTNPLPWPLLLILIAGILALISASSGIFLTVVLHTLRSLAPALGSLGCLLAFISMSFTQVRLKSATNISQTTRNRWVIYSFVGGPLSVVLGVLAIVLYFVLR